MTKIPESVGPYKILNELGKGGFATVYLAHHKDPKVSQRIALKVPNSSEYYTRFRREAETVARLKHSNIIRIFDTTENKQNGIPFFTMEYIPGGTLRDKLEAVTYLSRDEAMDIVRQIGAALNYAHEHGVIHRDVNPKNILLDERQKPSHSILTDFGLVKPLSADENLTMTVNLIGAFHYFAPEQWNREEILPATDIYALAITFFEMLAGQRPFKGDIFTLRDKHLNDPPPLLSQVAPAVGPFFDDVLARATAKIPEHRYKSVAQFVEALETANDKANLAKSYYEDGLRAYAAGNPGNLMQAIEILTDRIEALAEMRVKRDKVDLQEKLKLLQIKRHYDEGIEAFDTKTSENLTQIIAILTDKVKILDEMHAELERADLQKKLRALQVKAHHNDGLKAYAGGNPQDLAQAIAIVADKIQALDELDAERERVDLQEKLNVLRIKDLHYAGNQAFVDGISDNLAEAIAILEHNIQALDRLRAARESQDLEQKLYLLRIQERNANNYKSIETSVNNQEYEEALARLDKEFIRPRNYEYRDVARLFWGLVYAKQHNGQLPPEWTQTLPPKPLPRPEANNQNQELAKQRTLNTFIILSVMPAAIISGIIGAIVVAPTEVGQWRLLLMAAVALIALAWVACAVYYYNQIYPGVLANRFQKNILSKLRDR